MYTPCRVRQTTTSVRIWRPGARTSLEQQTDYFHMVGCWSTQRSVADVELESCMRLPLAPDCGIVLRVWRIGLCTHSHIRCTTCQSTLDVALCATTLVHNNPISAHLRKQTPANNDTSTRRNRISCNRQQQELARRSARGSSKCTMTEIVGGTGIPARACSRKRSHLTAAERTQC